MSNVEDNNKPQETAIKIKNQKTSNEIDLVSSEQRIVNNSDTSLSIYNNKQQSIFDKNINKTFDNKKQDLIYGTPYADKYPKKIGNLRVFFYINNSPLIVIGSNSK